ncbi:MAG: glycolate oxidase subunit GlcE [Hyphomicrobiaceae bacterium]|nr:glycolate oxidase subunit GlcE [Hyphomicrobiaceae bacterium]
MSDLIRPKDESELAAVVAEANAAKTPLEVCGAGSKRNVGRPLQIASSVTTERLRGVTLYEPNELVLSARAGTPLKDIEAALAKNNQQLAFEPVDLGPMLGEEENQATIGAVFAANLSGARRIQVGSARDHLLGIRAVTGRGEIIKSGGRVMKNVTGYDLCRGIAGSWGTLSVMSEVTMKVLPKPEAERTLLFIGLTDEVAIDALCRALGTPFEVSGTAHLHAEYARRLLDTEILRRPAAVTALRLENFEESLNYRADRLAESLTAFGKVVELDDQQSGDFWNGMRTLSFLTDSDDPVWRISTAPTDGSKVVSALSKRLDCRAAYDWSGGLIWLQTGPTADAGATEVRRVLSETGGHATLIRADASLRSSLDVFHPMSSGVAALTRKLKQSFDPAGVLNPGRMYAGI